MRLTGPGYVGCSLLFALVPAIHGEPADEGSSRHDPAAGAIVLENEHSRVEFSPTDGALIALRNKPAGLDLISALPDARTPWALLLDPFNLVSDFTGFSFTEDDGPPGKQVMLRWETPYDIVIHAEARLHREADRLELRCKAENRGKRTIIAFRYPAIEGIGPIGGRGHPARLLHSTMMGAVFKDPFHLFDGDATLPQARGLVISRYPNGFHGSALQLMAYYAEGRGGFYFAVEDGSGSDKDLNFYKAPGNRSLTCEFAHIQSDARGGNDLAVDYPVVIAPLTRGTWYEAAERYREWGVEQPWCARGTRRARAARGDACRWLLEEIGAVGMWWPFRQDIRREIRGTRELFGAPLLHLELWWSNKDSLATVRELGDRFGPFYFPLLALRGEGTFKDHAADAIAPPATPISPDWVAMCPAQPAWRRVVVESAEDLVGSGPMRHHQIWIDENKTGCGADALYYDIGPCAGVPTHCYAKDHVHPPGAGKPITRAYVSVFEESCRRASKLRGEYVPVGTECVTEPFVGCLDMHYPRNAGLSTIMETSPYVRLLTWLPDGMMEIVPLFDFVYHEYGPVAMQGIYTADSWMASEGDDFWTWAEARTTLWGGLVVIFPPPSGVSPSKARTRFLRSMVAARTGFAREFLAYGRLHRPPEIECETIAIDHGLAEGGWLRKAAFPPLTSGEKKETPEPKRPEKEKAASGPSVEEWVASLAGIPSTPATRPALSSPAILAQTYTLGTGRLGILLVDLRAQGGPPAAVPVDPVSFGLTPGTYRLEQVTAGGRRRLRSFENSTVVTLRVPPREFVLLEATRERG